MASEYKTDGLPGPGDGESGVYEFESGIQAEVIILKQRYSMEEKLIPDKAANIYDKSVIHVKSEIDVNNAVRVFLDRGLEEFLNMKIGNYKTPMMYGRTYAEFIELLRGREKLIHLSDEYGRLVREGVDFGTLSALAADNILFRSAKKRSIAESDSAEDTEHSKLLLPGKGELDPEFAVKIDDFPEIDMEFSPEEHVPTPLESAVSAISLKHGLSESLIYEILEKITSDNRSFQEMITYSEARIAREQKYGIEGLDKRIGGLQTYLKRGVEFITEYLKVRSLAKIVNEARMSSLNQVNDYELNMGFYAPYDDMNTVIGYLMTDYNQLRADGYTPTGNYSRWIERIYMEINQLMAVAKKMKSNQAVEWFRFSLDIMQNFDNVINMTSKKNVE